MILKIIICVGCFGVGAFFGITIMCLLMVGREYSHTKCKERKLDNDEHEHNTSI